jgi:hypothetical protein
VLPGSEMETEEFVKLFYLFVAGLSNVMRKLHYLGVYYPQHAYVAQMYTQKEEVLHYIPF